MISRWTRVRVMIFGVIFALCALRIGRRAVELQVERSEEMRARAEDQYRRDIELAPQRGRLIDRKGVELAASAEYESISCSPRTLMKDPGAVDKLAAALKLERRALNQTLQKAIEGGRSFAWIKRTVTPDESARVRALNLRGLHFDREPKREYPGGEAGATLIGFTNVDGRGSEGMEKALDVHLRGTVTRMQGMRDGSGREMLMDGLVDRRSTAGKDVVLTLSSYLTFVTHTALADAVKRWNAKGGSAVVMDPRNGEILAMTSVPSYDPNAPGDAVSEGRTRNRAITDLLEPGSTMKTFTIAATLEAGKVRPTDLIDCQSGTPLMIGRSRVRDLHPEGVITAAQVFQKSSNVGTVKIARQLGKQRLYEAMLRFGLGRRTGVGLGGERPGVVYPVQKWGDIHFANIAFGYGFQVTPLQMVAGYAAIANGGMYNSPRLVSKVIHPDGRHEPMPLPPSARPPQRVLSQATARTMLEIMTGVTSEGGTAKAAALDGFLVAGKTGTAQKVVNGKYGPWISSFIGIVPANDPQLVIAVIIDEPEPEHRGGMVAAPAFREIAERALQHLAVPPDPALLAAAAAKPRRPSLPVLAIVQPNGAGGAAIAGAPTGMETELVEGPGSEQPLWGGPEDLEDTTLVLGEEEGEGGEVTGDAGPIVPEGMISVPSFVGMTIGEAIRAAREAGVEIAPEGSGLAVAQSPSPGARSAGTLCRVSFRPGG